MRDVKCPTGELAKLARDIDSRLAELSIPLARLMAGAGNGRSTWSDWRAGRTTPRPDRWAAATAAFNALVAEATPAPAEIEPEAAGAEPVTLSGSSAPTGAPPSFTPVATAASVAGVQSATEAKRETADVATLKQIAAREFTPFDFAGWEPDTIAEWCEVASSILVTARMAYRFLLFDKAKAVNFVAQLTDGTFPGIDDESFFERVDGAAAFFEVYAEVMDAARSRLLTAGAVLAMRQDAEAAARAGA